LEGRKERKKKKVKRFSLQGGGKANTNVSMFQREGEKKKGSGPKSRKRKKDKIVSERKENREPSYATGGGERKLECLFGRKKDEKKSKKAPYEPFFAKERTRGKCLGHG